MIGASLAAAKTAQPKKTKTQILRMADGTEYDVPMNVNQAYIDQVVAYHDQVTVPTKKAVKEGGKKVADTLTGMFGAKPAKNDNVTAFFQSQNADKKTTTPVNPKAIAAADKSMQIANRRNPKGQHLDSKGNVIPDYSVQTGIDISNASQKAIAEVIKSATNFAGGVIGGVSGANSVPGGQALAEKLTTDAVAGLINTPINIAANAGNMMFAKDNSIENVLKSAGNLAVDLLPVEALPGVKAIKRVFKSGDAIGEDFAKALGSAEGSGLPKRPLTDVPQYNPKRVPTEPKPVSEPSVTAPKATKEPAQSVTGGVKEPWQMTREQASRSKLPGVPKFRVTKVIFDPDAKSVMGARVELLTPSGWKEYHKLIRPEQSGHAGDMIPFGAKGKDAVAEDMVRSHFSRVFDAERDLHKFDVIQALEEGKPVPPEVLADYPDLAAKYKQPTPGKVSSDAGKVAKPGLQAGSESGRSGQQISPDLREIKRTNATTPTPNTPKPVEAPQKPVQAPETASVKEPNNGKTGVSMYARTKDAETYGTAVPESIKGATNEEAFNAAKASYVPGRPTERLHALAKEKSPASQRDIAAFAVERGNHIAEIDALGKKLDADPTNEALRTEYNDLHAKIAEFDKSLDIVKAENGRGLNALKIGNRIEDMSFEEVKAEAKRRYNIDLNPKQEKLFKDLETKVSEHEATIADLETKLKEASVASRVTHEAKQSRTIRREAIVKEIDDLWEEFKGIKGAAGVAQGKTRGARATVGAEDVKVAADQLHVIGKIAIRYAKLGAISIDDIVKTVIETAASRGWTIDRQHVIDGIDAVTTGEKKQRTLLQEQYQYLVNQAKSESSATRTRDALKAELESGNLIPPSKHERVISSTLRSLQDEVKSLRRQKVARLNALEPTSLVKKATAAGRGAQLANPYARVMDALQNKAKLVSYVAQNPGRSLLGEIGFGRTVGRDKLLTPGKLYRVLEGSKSRWAQEARDVLRGTDLDTIEKYGKAPGAVTRVTGLTDVPFKDFYYRLGLEDYAQAATATKRFTMPLTAAKRAQGSQRVAAFRQLTEGIDGPLTAQQVEEAKILAHDLALRQTLNVDNIASDVAEGTKTWVAKKIEARVGGKAGKDYADGWRAMADTITRFNRVIFNSALDKANYAYGLQESAVRLAAGKRSAGLLGQIPAKDARLIVDLASKGLAGIATVKAGQVFYDSYIKKNPHIIKGEIVTTTGGTKFVKWTLFPDIHGGIDADQLGGLVAPLLDGATQRLVEDQNLKPKQKEALIARYRTDQYFNSPITSGPSDFLKVIHGEKDLGQYAGSLMSRNIIPGGMSEFARRQDESQTGTNVRKSDSFWDEFIKRFPKTPLNPETNRQTLPKGDK